jgi:hypothetical protein
MRHYTVLSFDDMEVDHMMVFVGIHGLDGEIVNIVYENDGLTWYDTGDRSLLHHDLTA